jgi:flagellar hook-associated protein 2
MGILDTDGDTADGITSGVETDQFRSTTTSIGSLLGLSGAQSGTVVVGGQNVAIDLAEDSLTDIQSKIDAAGLVGVTTSIVSSTDEDDNSLFALRVDGTSDFVDDNNVLETADIVLGSNSAFESVARVLTANGTNLAKGAVKNAIADGAKSDVLSSDADTIETLLGSSAAGTITIGDQTVAIDFATDTLADIRDNINAAAPTGVTASINVIGPTEFELQIDGTTEFSDSGGVLQELGVLAAPTTLTADTRLADIVDAGVQSGDTISISGVDHDGNQVSGSFTISSTNLKVNSLLNSIEQTFGNSVTASVDSSGRIVLADDEAGSSSISLTLEANNEGGGGLNLGELSVTTQGIAARSSVLQAGQDSSFSINGITLSRATNTVTDAVQGITLDLKEAEVGSNIEINVTKDDTTELRENINKFVADFNSSMELIDQQFAVDESTQRGGPLAGDSTIIALQSRLRSIVTTQISGLEEGFSALVLIGINFDRSGRLNIDDERLTDALNENLEDVRRLFVARGSTTDDSLEFVSSNRNTNQGTYAVSVTQAASSASLVSDQELLGSLAEDHTLTVTDKATDSPAIIELKAGESLDQVVTKINTTISSDVAEVRRASIANTTNGTLAVGGATAFADIFGADVSDGDTIRINGTAHNGNSVTTVFTIADTSSDTVADLLASVRNAFNGNVSTSIDSDGRIVVTDNQVGPSQLTVTLIEENEGGGNLNFGSIDIEDEGRFALDITASNSGGRLAFDHNSSGERNGFSISEAITELGLAQTEVAGTDVQGTINGEEADGFGRILTGKLDADNVQGLSLRVDLSGDELASSGGNLGDVQLVYGVGRLLSDALGFITDSFDGSLKGRQDAIESTIDDLDDQIASMNRRIEQKRLGLVSKFARLEGSLATLQSQGDFLSSQLAGLSR